MLSLTCLSFFFFFNDTATTEIYTLSLHDALPILAGKTIGIDSQYIHVAGIKIPTAVLALLPITLPQGNYDEQRRARQLEDMRQDRSEEHTSEIQSRLHLVCRLLLEKKKK